MNLLTRAPLLRACFLATLVYHTVPTESLGPVVNRLRIPAPRFTMNEIIRAVARKHHVKPAFVKSIIAAESGFLPTAVSPKGAVGLMQLMPATAREFRADPAGPQQNVEAGAPYLSWPRQRYAHRRHRLPRTL